MRKKRGRGAPRHRSPTPPPSRVINKTSYRRSREKARWRRELERED